MFVRVRVVWRGELDHNWCGGEEPSGGGTKMWRDYQTCARDALTLLEWGTGVSLKTYSTLTVS